MKNTSTKTLVASALAAVIAMSTAAPMALAQPAASQKAAICAQSCVVDDQDFAERIAMASLGIDRSYVVSFDTSLDIAERCWQVGMELTDGRTYYVKIAYDTGDIIDF